MPLVFGGGGNVFQRLQVMPHPLTKDVWIIGYSSPVGGMGGASAYRVTVADDGALALVQGPTDIGGSDIGQQVVLRPDGKLMVMAGFSGGCTAAWQLPASNALPTAAERINACNGNFSNGTHVAVRPASGFFYHSTPAGALRVGEVTLGGGGALVDHGTMAVGTGDLQLALAYGGSILVTADAATGAVKAFTVGANETALTPVGSQTAPTGTRGLSVARCGR